jgi:DNA replication protein DnaC
MELTVLLERMKMEHLLAQLDGVCEQAATGDLDFKGFLARALETEWHGRYQRGVEGRLKQARLPWIKTLDQFDFDFQPSIDRKVIRELAGGSFIERAHNVVLLGPPGVGKTHLAIALGVTAVEAGYSALFLTLESLMGRLIRARHENRLDRTLQQLTYPRLLILDELGYLPLSREEASLFFRLLVRRYERGSLIVTSNKSLADWGEVFNDQVLATAILDRLLHHATTLNIKGRAIGSRKSARPACSGAANRPERRCPTNRDAAALWKWRPCGPHRTIPTGTWKSRPKARFPHSHERVTSDQWTRTSEKKGYLKSVISGLRPSALTPLVSDARGVAVSSNGGDSLNSCSWSC